MQNKAVLVTGATGTQGGAVVEALIAADIPAIAYVRDVESDAAKALAGRGVTLVAGQLDNVDRLAEAMAGVQGVFCVPLVGGEDDPGLELRAGKAVVQAAVKAGVAMFVHSSVARAGDHEQFDGWAEGRWWARYWEDKASLNQIVRSAGLQRWCILKPAVLMDNFIPPKVHFMFPHLAMGEVVSAMRADTRLDLVAAADVGAFAVAAFRDPARFAGQEIDLAGESLTMEQVARTLTEVTGGKFVARHLSESDALASGLLKMVVDGHLWDDVEGYRVDTAAVARWGVPLTSFRSWAAAHRAALDARMPAG